MNSQTILEAKHYFEAHCCEISLLSDETGIMLASPNMWGKGISDESFLEFLEDRELWEAKRYGVTKEQYIGWKSVGDYNPGHGERWLQCCWQTKKGKRCRREVYLRSFYPEDFVNKEHERIYCPAHVKK